MSTPCHALVFRDVREQLCLNSAHDAIEHDINDFLTTGDRESLLSAFLRAGEAECALADSGTHLSDSITYFLSEAVVDPERSQRACEIALSLLRTAPSAGVMTASRPEGFAFYGLNPVDYSSAIQRIDFGEAAEFVVIGIRSIGVALGACVAAALRKKFPAKRTQFLSVRPTGHPYDRHCDFSPELQATIQQRAEGTKFIVVDEGPGLSGSSFLSVGEALLTCGVETDDIHLLCSRCVDSAALVTHDGAQRWNRFQSHVVERQHFKPEPTALLLSPANERSYGAWNSMMPPRYRSADGKSHFEYHGLGRYGDAVRQRINRIASAGFTMPVTKVANGFSRSEHVLGRRLGREDLSHTVLERMADYLAHRANACCVDADGLHLHDLEEMARFNLQQAIETELPSDFHLALHRPVISDSQMMPHAWLRPDDGGPLLKSECGTHGDGHFVPGPVDIAWDIAGAIIEWKMDGASRAYFIACYDAAAEDNVASRLDPYLIAYAAFRNGYCRMAASAMAHDADEATLLSRDAERYRNLLESLTAEKSLAASYE